MTTSTLVKGADASGQFPLNDQRRRRILAPNPSKPLPSNHAAAGSGTALTSKPTGFAVSAVPTSFGSTGSRTFYADQGMDIHYNDGQEPATVNSPIVGKAAAKAGDTK